MPKNDAHARAQQKFDAKIRKITIRLNPDHQEEREIIEFLDNSGNKQGTIKRALSRYMADKRNETTPPE